MNLLHNYIANQLSDRVTKRRVVVWFDPREEFADFDAERKFDLGSIRTSEPEECMAGDVLRGQIKPFQCPAFGEACTPEKPLGAPMVSSEGACAAYYNYARFQPETAGEPT